MTIKYPYDTVRLIWTIKDKKIEVAFSKSTSSDMADIEEGEEKGRTPKEIAFCRQFLGHMLKKHVTVIRH